MLNKKILKKFDKFHFDLHKQQLDWVMNFLKVRLQQINVGRDHFQKGSGKTYIDCQSEQLYFTLLKQ